MQAIDINKVMKVYSGKPGCRCGCKGNYRVASAHLHAANVTRGYDHDASDVNDKQVRKVVALLNANLASVEFEDDFADIELNGRVYTAYFVPTQEELDRILARRAKNAPAAVKARELAAFDAAI